MAGNARYTALLDACVLHPATVANALISLAVAGLYAAKWTQAIEAEWLHSVARALPALAGSGKLERRRDDMRAAVPDWEVAAARYRRLLPSLSLPDSGDVHVLAAAMAGHADCIVTSNLKDFPEVIVTEHEIEVIHPDDFIVMQLDLDPVIGLTALKGMRQRMRNPVRTVEEFAVLLERSQLFSTAQRVRDAAGLI